MPSSLHRPLPPARQSGALLRKLIILMLIGSLMLISMLAVNEVAYQGARKAVEKGFAYQQEKKNARGLIQNLIQAETHLKDYIETNDDSHLKLYQAARQQAQGRYEKLDALVQNSATPTDQSPTVASPKLAQLQQKVSARLQALDNLLTLARSGNSQALAQAISVYPGDQSLTRSPSIDLLLLLENNEQIQELQDKTMFFLRLSQLALVIMSLICLLVFCLYLHKINADSQEQFQRQTELEKGREHLEKLVQQRTQSLSALASHLHDIRDDERANLARELHDELGSLLAAGKLHIANLQLQLSPETANQNADEIHTRLAQLRNLFEQMFAIKQRIIENLHPPSLEDLGLTKSLQILAEQFAQSTGITIQMDLPGDTDGITPKGCLTLYRIAQEALSNAAKYAQATTVQLHLHNPPAQDAVCLEISDNGKGFDPQATTPTNYGLRSMQHRVESLGGQWTLQSSPGAGTTIKAQLPATGPDDSDCG